MNAGDYHSYMNNADLMRQQLIQLFADSLCPNLKRGSGIRTLSFPLGIHTYFGNKICEKKLLTNCLLYRM